MENILIRRAGGRLRAYPTHTHIRVACHLGTADLRHVTDDGWAALRIDGDSNPQREDEVYLGHCTPIAGAEVLAELVRTLIEVQTSPAVAA